MGRLSDALHERLAAMQPDEWVDVIVELEPPTGAGASAPRQARMSALKEHFADRAEPVQNAVRALGGEVTGTAWINQSMAVRLRAHEVPRLRDVEAVSLIDVPHSLEREGGGG